MTTIDHASIAGGMKCIPLPRRKRGGQAAEAEAEFERTCTEWCQEIIRSRQDHGLQNWRAQLVLRAGGCSAPRRGPTPPLAIVEAPKPAAEVEAKSVKPTATQESNDKLKPKRGRCASRTYRTWISEIPF